MNYPALIVSVIGLAALSASASVVKIQGAPGSFTLVRDGKPYFVRGAAGGGPKDLLKKLGGNSYRTWGATDAKEQLDEAQKLGLTVTVGHWLGHAEHGFNYLDKAALEKQTADVLAVVRACKDHPALLMWSLGNEMEMNNPHRREMWAYIDDLARQVKAIDPNHPVITVVAEIPDANVREFNEFCPHLDAIGINTYGGCVSVVDRWVKAGGKKPVIVTEYGPAGTWEGANTPFGCPIELTSTEKADRYAAAAKAYEAQRGKWSLGAYAFTWGHKVEATPTWFGLLLPDNSKLAGAEALAAVWGGAKPANRVPRISKLTLSKDDLGAAGETFTAAATASDPDNDNLTWKWTLLSEMGNYGVEGTGAPMPAGFKGAIVAGQGTSKVTVKLPGGGKYRLYAYVFDGHGNAAYANAAVRGPGPEPAFEAPVAALPCRIYGDGVQPRWYPSGYMGSTGNIKMNEGCTENPHEGRVCIRVDYTRPDNWGGVMWQDPPNDWGNKAGGVNLSGAATLVFWARGAQGGEKVSFSCGGLGADLRYHDTFKAELKDVELKTTWTRYRIPLDGKDLSTVKTAFCWVVGGNGRPITFYLDDISYIKD